MNRAEHCYFALMKSENLLQALSTDLSGGRSAFVAAMNAKANN
jgi:D-alanyl-D-alanine carboxypeptidase